MKNKNDDFYKSLLEKLLNTNASKSIFDKIDKGHGVDTEEGKLWIAARESVRKK